MAKRKTETMKTKENQRRRAKQRYEDRKAKGLCQYCPNKAEPGHIRCATCREITADYCAGRYDIRKVNDICVRCGKNPQSTETFLCEDCREKRRTKKEFQNGKTQIRATASTAV